jgi:hypothetical protein
MNKKRQTSAKGNIWTHKIRSESTKEETSWVCVRIRSVGKVLGRKFICVAAVVRVVEIINVASLKKGEV